MDGNETDSGVPPTEPETIALGPEGSTRPVEWDRHQMETDDAAGSEEGDATADREDGSGGAAEPKWNKGEMAEERQDHTRAPLPAADELAEPAGGLSGGGSNPGGGERWADRDRER